MPTTFSEVVEGSFGGGASHLRQALHLEVVLFAYQMVHIALQACYMYQGRLDDYDVVIPLISLVFCARRLLTHFASSPDPLDLGPHCWLLLRMLLVGLLCANAGYFGTVLVHRHSFSALVKVLAGVAVVGAGPAVMRFDRVSGLAADLITCILRACESAYYVGCLPVLLPKSPFMYWEPRLTIGLTLTVWLNSFVLLLAQLLALKYPQLAIHSQAYHAQRHAGRGGAEGGAGSGGAGGRGSGAANGGGCQGRAGAAAVGSASSSSSASLLAVPAMPSEWEEQPLLLRAVARRLLAEPDHAHMALIIVSHAAPPAPQAPPAPPARPA